MLYGSLLDIPVKIALLSFEYPPETGFGGIGTYTWYQARSLARLGHEVHVLAGATEETALRRSEHDGVAVFRFRAGGWWMRRFKQLGARDLRWSQNRLENALSMWRGLGQLLEQHRYDVLEMPECGAEGLLVTRRCPIPSVVRFHSPAQLIMGTYDVTRNDHRLCGWIERLALGKATGYSSCSAFLAREVESKMGVRPPITVIPNGLDLGLFDAGARDDQRTRLGIPRETPVVLFSGRLEPRKGIQVMKDVVPRVLARHQAAFVFAGQDLFGYAEREMRPRLEAQRLRGSYHFLGRIGLSEVRSWLLQADVFVIPSLWENCPYSCLEAMAAGRAIVSSDAGGMPELIEDGVNGLVAPTGDVAATASCIERLLADRGLRERLGRAARQRVEQRYTDEIVGRQSLDLYRRVAGI